MPFDDDNRDRDFNESRPVRHVELVPSSVFERAAMADFCKSLSPEDWLAARAACAAREECAAQADDRDCAQVAEKAERKDGEARLKSAGLSVIALPGAWRVCRPVGSP